MYVEFEYVMFRNFLSYPALETKIDFKSGLNLVSAPIGSGKSAAILDTLSYNLYGKPYRKIKIEELINRTNKKKLYTESQFRINKDTYKIIRQLKPNKLEVLKNDNPLELLSSNTLTQEDIDKILGIDHKMFRNVVALATNYNKPFFVISKGEKRELLEMIFNVDVFGSMLKILKKNITQLKIDIEIENNTIEIQKQTLITEKNRLTELKQSKKEFEKNKEDDIETIEDNIDLKGESIKNAENKVKKYQKQLNELEETNKKLINDYKEKIKKEQKQTEDEINDLNIEYSTKEKMHKDNIKEFKEEIVTINEDYDEEYPQLKSKLEKYDDIDEENKERLESDIRNFEDEIFSNNKEIEQLKKKIHKFETRDVCPECEEIITEEKREQKILEKNKKISELNKKNILNNKSIDTNKEELQKIKDKMELKEELIDVISHKEKSITELNEKIEKYTSMIESVNKELKYEINEVNNNSKVDNFKNEIEKIKNSNVKGEVELKIEYESTQAELYKKEIKDYKKKILEIKEREFKINIDKISKEFNEKVENYKIIYEKYKKNTNKMDNYGLVKEILSEKGIKSFFFRKLIPILNQKINAYLNKFNLPISIVFDEQMNERISALGGSDQNISYHCYSGGERKKIDLSILFSLVDVMKIVANWSCNLLVGDEIADSGSDAESLELLLDSLKEMTLKAKNLCVYVVSHKVSDDSIFDNIIKIEKDNNFSRIVE